MSVVVVSTMSGAPQGCKGPAVPRSLKAYLGVFGHLVKCSSSLAQHPAAGVVVPGQLVKQLKEERF